jgi:polygalacturonase
VRAEDVTIKGVRLRNSAAWVCHLFQSNNVTIRSIDIHSHVNQNNDGIDIDSTTNVLIEDCVIDTGDDAVCIKATSPLPTENVLVRNCTLTSDWGAFKLGTESMGDFKNIRFIDSVIKDTKGGAIKILSMDGCRLENLTIDNITVTNSDMPIFMRLGERLNKYREDEARTPGHIKGVSISNIAVETSGEGRLLAPTAIVMTGERTDQTTHMIEDVAIRDVTITIEGGGRVEDVSEVVERTRRNNYPEYIFMFDRGARRVYPSYGIYARHVKDIRFDNIRIETRQADSRPFIYLQNAHGIQLDATTNAGNGPFLQTENVTGLFQR